MAKWIPVPGSIEFRLAIGKMRACVLVDLDDQDLQHQRQPEHRRRQPEEADRRRRVVEGGVLTPCGGHADPDRDEDREELGDEDELQCVLHHPPEVGQDRSIAQKRGPELVRHRVPHPVPVSDRDRVVEMLAVDDVLARLLGEVRDDVQLRERVARDRDEREHEEARRGEDDDAVEQSANDVAQHDATPRMVEALPPRATRAGPRGP